MNPDRQRALEEQLALEISRTEKLRATIMALAFTSGFVIALLIFQVWLKRLPSSFTAVYPVSYTHLRAHETVLDLVCRLLLEKKNYQTSTS